MCPKFFQTYLYPDTPLWMYIMQYLSTFCETLCTIFNCSNICFNISIFHLKPCCCFTPLEVSNYIEILDKTQKSLKMKILITVINFEI